MEFTRRGELPAVAGGDLTGSPKGGYVPAVCRRERTIARRSQPPRRTSTRKPGLHPHGLAQIAHQNEPVVTSKCASGRPLLIDSAPPTEFPVTPSKQRRRKFLTGARTHIRIFSFCTFTTQNPSQLIHRRRYRINPRRSNRRHNPCEIPKTVSPENSTVTLFLSRLPSQLDQRPPRRLPRRRTRPP